MLIKINEVKKDKRKRRGRAIKGGELQRKDVDKNLSFSLIKR